MDTLTNENNVNNSSESTTALSKHCRKRKPTQQSTDPTSQEVPTSSRVSTRTRKARKKTPEAIDDKTEDVAAATSTSSTGHLAPAPSFTLTLPPIAAIDAKKHLVETQDQDGNPVTMFQYDGRRFPVNARFLVPPRPYTRRKKLDPNPMASTRVVRPPPVPPAAPAGPQAIKSTLNQPPVHTPDPYMFLPQNNFLPMDPPSYHHSPSVTPHVVSANAPTPRTTRDVGVDTASDVFSIRTTQDISIEVVTIPTLRTTRDVGIATMPIISLLRTTQDVGVDIRPDGPSAHTTYDVGMDTPSPPHPTLYSDHFDVTASLLHPRDTPTPPPIDVDFLFSPGPPSQRLDPPGTTDFIKGVVDIELSAKAPKPGNNKPYKDGEPSQIASDASGTIRVPNVSAENARTTVISNTKNAVDNASDRSVEAIPSVEVILKTRERCKQLAERLRRRRTELGMRGAQFDGREARLKERLEVMRKRLWEENRVWEQDLRHEQGEVAALEKEDAKREVALKKLTDQVEELEAMVSPLTS